MKQPEQTRRLLHKAGQDEAVMDALMGQTAIDDETFGFHAQQAVEKLLKAWLSARGVDYPKTHNLRAIVDLLTATGPPLPNDLKDVDSLTPYATIYRYEDVPVSGSFDQKQVREQVRRVRAYVEGEIRKLRAVDT